MPLSWLSPSVVRAVMRGGLHGVASRLRRAFSLASITAYVRDQLGVSDVDDRNTLIGLAQAARDAGDQIAALPAELAIDVQLIPVIPSLPEGFWGGGRVKWDVEIPWHSPDTGRSGTWRWSFFGESGLSGEELLQIAQDKMAHDASSSPEQFGAGLFDLPEVVVDDVIVIDVARAY